MFGAYCSTRWFERNLKDDNGHRQAYFGTGETFLFSLYPDRAKYPWVGIDGDKNLGHGSELFMAADNSMITIGGGYVYRNEFSKLLISKNRFFLFLQLQRWASYMDGRRHEVW